MSSNVLITAAQLMEGAGDLNFDEYHLASFASEDEPSVEVLEAQWEEAHESVKHKLALAAERISSRLIGSVGYQDAYELLLDILKDGLSTLASTLRLEYFAFTIGESGHSFVSENSEDSNGECFSDTESVAEQVYFVDDEVHIDESKKLTKQLISQIEDICHHSCKTFRAKLEAQVQTPSAQQLISSGMGFMNTSTNGGDNEEANPTVIQSPVF